MKKIFCIFILIILMFSLSICVFAKDDTPTFVVDTKNGKPGETVNINISIKNNPGLASAKFVVTFDSSLELIKIEYGNIGGMTMLPEKNKSPIILNWFSVFTELKTDTVYATLSFKLPTVSSKSFYPITIQYNQNDVFDINEKDVYFDIINGGINVDVQTSTTSEYTSYTETTSIPHFTQTSNIPYTQTETSKQIQTSYTTQVETTTHQTTESSNVYSSIETILETTKETTYTQTIGVETETISTSEINTTSRTSYIDTTNIETTNINNETTNISQNESKAYIIPLIILGILVVAAVVIGIIFIKKKK